MTLTSTTERQSGDRPRVLCVDDERAVLDGMVRNHRGRYQLVTAISGEEALSILAEQAPFDVIVSDMRMPGMSGAEFLGRAALACPDTTRILLTGHADLESTLKAVNEGRIFRFLCKPCSPSEVVQAVDAGVEQRRLIVAEREVLEKTLRGCVQALVDTLALANPVAFARATTIRRMLERCRPQFDDVADWWQIEIAAMLSQLGAIALPPSVLAKMHKPELLSDSERELLDRLPSLSVELLESIPRLGPVRAIIMGQNEPFVDGRDDPPFGSRLLRIIRDYDDFEAAGWHADRIVSVLRHSTGIYDPEVVERFATAIGADSGSQPVYEVDIDGLATGQIFYEAVYASGTLVVGKGHPVTSSLIFRLRHLIRDGLLQPQLRFLVLGG